VNYQSVNLKGNIMTAIVSTDVLFLMSAPGATSGYSTTGTVGNSWGNYVSVTQLSSTPLDNLFPDITGAENAADQVDYACVFILNNTTSGNTMLNTVAWMPSAYYVTGGATVSIAADPTGATTKASSSQQAVKITSSVIAPAGVTGWVSPTGSAPAYPSYTNGIVLGSLAPGYCTAVWVRRSATNSAPVNNDGFTLEIDFDTQG
jgi:hypothetical protein